ncbi:MAG: peptidoglycan DD-metalloendopeptidase family protein [Clostridiales bacterium]|nr:peptidoglycan DD-metalloendopeptidase family protein [Clostridiales bacterium]
MKKIIMLVLMLILSVNTVYATDDIDKQEELLESIQEQLDALDGSHSDFVNQKNAVVRNIRSLEDSVRNTENEIDNLKVQITENNIRIGEATMALEAAKQALAVTNDLLDQRIRIMYMNGTVGYFEVVLESKNFEDLLSRIEMLRRIVESDTSLIEQMEIDKQLVDDKKLALEEEQEKLIALENDMQNKRAELKAQIANLQVKQRELLNDIAALEIQIDDTNKDAEKVKSIIADLKLREQYVGGAFTWPVPSSYKITSGFGMRRHPILNTNKLHTGIDIGGGEGLQVVAAQEGKVIWAGWLSSYGKCVMIDHGGGIVTLYAHNSSLSVTKGQDVSRGQNIALTGSTGNVTGPHLHFEVREEGEYVDPEEKWLTGN